MKIDFSVVLKDLDGKPLKDGGEEVTLKSITQMALMAQFRDEAELAATEKVRRFALAMTIQNSNGAAELPVEDVAEIKRLIGRAMGPLVVGRAYELLS
jgi:hypothetical protein